MGLVVGLVGCIIIGLIPYLYTIHFYLVNVVKQALTNLPLQLLLAEQLMELLNKVADQVAYEADRAAVEFPNSEITVTSLVQREHLQSAFPIGFDTWRLDKLGNLTTREAFCRVQGLEQPPWWV